MFIKVLAKLDNRSKSCFELFLVPGMTPMREAYQQDDMVKAMILTEEESVVELCGLKLGDDLDVEKKQLINDLKDKQLSLLRSIEAELGYAKSPDSSPCSSTRWR